LNDHRPSRGELALVAKGIGLIKDPVYKIVYGKR
jgi:hypothetical protein